MNFFAVLGLIFITLKLMGYIAWSWWLVTLPLTGGVILLCVAAVVVYVDAFFTARKHVSWRGRK